MISSTHQLVSLNDDKHKYLNLEESTTDRTEISDKVGCQPDKDYNEDDCLLRCLIKQMSEELGCLHPRLAFLEQAKDFSINANKCDYADLLQPTVEYYEQMTKDRAEFGLFSFRRNDTTDEEFVSIMEDVGLRMIKDRLAMYSVVSVETEDLEDNMDEVNRERCGCKVPCKGHSVKIRPVKDDEAYRRDWVFIYFQVLLYAYMHG